MTSRKNQQAARQYMRTHEVAYTEALRRTSSARTASGEARAGRDDAKKVFLVVIGRPEFLDEGRTDPEVAKALASDEVVVVSVEDLYKGNPVPDPPSLSDLPKRYFMLRYDFGLFARWGSSQLQCASAGERKWRDFCDAVTRLSRANDFDVDLIV